MPSVSPRLNLVATVGLIHVPLPDCLLRLGHEMPAIMFVSLFEFSFTESCGHSWDAWLHRRPPPKAHPRVMEKSPLASIVEMSLVCFMWCFQIVLFASVRSGVDLVLRGRSSLRRCSGHLRHRLMPTSVGGTSCRGVI